MKKQIKTTFFLIFLLFGLIACTQSEQVAPTAVSEVVEIEEVTSEPESTASPTAVPTETPSQQPSPTTEPTATVEPTDTPEPSPTPDLTGGGSGKIIFVSDRDGEETFSFYIMNYDGSEPEAWVDVPNPLSDATSRFVPRYSPDGSKIAYVLEQDGAFNIFVANVDGTEALQLTTYTDPLYGFHPSWSLDGTQIIFDTNEDNGIHIINADGTNHISLIENHTGIKGYPAWSPDGTAIVFNWGYDIVTQDYTQDMEIMVMNPDGTNITPLTDNDFTDIGAVWSPDGTKIAFHSNRDGNFEIYVMNADGSEQTRLTDNDVDDFSPAWSPNGELIAYTAVLKNEDDSRLRQVIIMNADGSNPRNLTEGQNGFNPYWLP